MTSKEVGLLSALTSVLWLMCVAVGVTGLLVSYPWPRPPARDAPPIQAQTLNVEVASLQFEAPAVNTHAPTPDIAQPPPTPDAAAAPPSPTMVALATHIAAPAFIQPTTKPLRRASPIQTSFVAPEQAVASASSIHHITFGQGEGRQPAPEYPSEAALAGQQGVVVVRLAVNEDGNVTGAQAILPCRWPLLNRAALRAVRETWHFAGGPRRLYEVSIRFELTE